MNKVVLIGYLTKKPELRYTQSGQAVTQFTLAVDKNLSREKRQEMEAQGRPTADFPRIVVWGKQAESLCQYLGKGSRCAIEGSIQTGSYQDNSGNHVFTTDIVAQHVEFLSGSSHNSTEYNSNTKTRQGRQNGSQEQIGANNNDDDFFEDDFQEIDDGNAIPF